MQFSRNILLLLILSACSIQEIETSHSFQIYKKNGDTIAETTGGPKYEGELFTYEPVLTLKEDPLNEASLLFRPGEFTMDEDGFFYVLDYGDSRIAVFNPEGNYLKSFGRKGQGPGEFVTMSDLNVHNGIVSVYDTNSNRTTRFSTDGTLLNIVTVPTPTSDISSSRSRVRTMHVLDDGRLVLLKYEYKNVGEAQLLGGSVVVLGTSNDTLWTVEMPFVQTGIFTPMSNGGMLSFGLPLSSGPVVEYVHGQGIVLFNGVDPELIWFNLDGTIKRNIQLGLDPIPITAEDRAKVRTLYEERLANAKDNNERMIPMSEAMLKALVFPDNRPYWRGVISDDSGCLWLLIPEHTVDREAAGGGYLFRIVSSEGEYLGNTRVSYASSFNVVQGKLMVRWTPPETESPELLICNIRSAVEGLVYP